MADDNFCKNCGNALAPGSKVCPNCGNELKESHKLSIILGYIFSILGGLIGLVFSIYNMTRDDEETKKHGKIQFVIFLIVTIVCYIILYAR